MKHLLATSISIALLSLGVAGCSEKQAAKEVTQDAFVTIQGQDLIKPDGTKPVSYTHLRAHETGT